nr:MAG TPA: hypothetical protein [Caudoviricetes sp.]
MKHEVVISYEKPRIQTSSSYELRIRFKMVFRTRNHIFILYYKRKSKLNDQLKS